MESKDYYALIKHRGKIKYYYVSAESDEYLRIEYIDYNPNRNNMVWLKNGKDRITKKFNKGSDEYKYFSYLRNEFKRLVHNLAVNEFDKSEDKTLADIFYYSSIGTYYMKKAYKEAYKNISKPKNIDFKV